jgi:hypothetical protein
MRQRVLVPLALMVAPCFAAAQAPRITPAGGPSVRNDTIYALRWTRPSIGASGSCICWTTE